MLNRFGGASTDSEQLDKSIHFRVMMPQKLLSKYIFLSTSFAIIRQVADSIDFYFDDCIHVSLYLYQNLIDSNILQASLYTLAGACSSELGIIFYICVYEYLCLYVPTPLYTETNLSFAKLCFVISRYTMLQKCPQRI